jgi:hypothetical protein
MLPPSSGLKDLSPRDCNDGGEYLGLLHRQVARSVTNQNHGTGRGVDLGWG